MIEAGKTGQVSCKDPYDPNALPVQEALTRIRAELEPILGKERVAVRSSLNRVLAEAVVSPLDVPAHVNSAMDGFAIAAAHLEGRDAVQLKVIGTAFAGKPFPGPVGPGECARIMTGAVVPEGCDTVVMQEDAKVEGDWVRIGTGHRLGENVRHAGEDLPRGSKVMAAGTRVGAAELGLLASLGFAEVEVIRRPRVAFFSTGDELKSLGQPLGLGDVYDSNRYTLYGMLERFGAEILDMGVVPDRRDLLAMAFRQASTMADVVITSGGVSVGEADFVRETLQSLGRVSFWKIAMKPGRPLAFGHMDGGAYFFGLPGNPVAVMVTFYQFVRPALSRLIGEPGHSPLTFSVPCATRIRKRPGRTEYQRGVLFRDDEGRLSVRTTGGQGSGILSSVSQANCFIILGHDSESVEVGSSVEVQPFEGMN